MIRSILRNFRIVPFAVLASIAVSDSAVRMKVFSDKLLSEE